MRELTALIIMAVLQSFQIPKPFDKFIKQYAPLAQEIQKQTGVPASIQLAQAIIESGGGKSYIAVNARNWFGIRWYKNTTDYDAFYDRAGNPWRCYNTIQDGWYDHAHFLCEHYEHAIGKNYIYWSYLNGYGGVNYWKKVGEVVKKYNLNRFDN